MDLRTFLGFVFEQVPYFVLARVDYFAASVLRLVFIGLGCTHDTRIRHRMCWKHSKYNGFRKVSLFQVISELDHFQSTFGCLFGSFLGTLGSFFIICQCLGSRFGNRRFSRGTLGGPRLRAPGQVGLKTFIGGPYNNLETERHCNYRTSTGSWKRANYEGCRKTKKTWNNKG